jgi:hypothetical protein
MRTTQEQEAQGWEGRLAPARVEQHSTSEGKPPFLTTSFCVSNFSSNLNAFWD